MATLKSKTLTAINNAGDRLELTFPASVSDAGVFSLRLPTDMQGNDEFKRAVLRARSLHAAMSWRDERVNSYIDGQQLDGLAHAVQAAMHDYLTVDTTIETVIVFGADTKAAFWLNPNGTVAQNGHLGDRGGRWNEDDGLGGLHATNTVEAFRVGVYARVWERVTHARGTSTRTLYRNAESHALEPAAEELNGFCALSVRPEEIVLGRTRNGMTLRTIPYTAEAALFFTDALFGVIRLARDINSFFGDEQRLALAVSSKTPLLTAPQA